MADSNFPACLAFTLQFEGGYVNNPRDPGGATNMGVTQAVYSRWRVAQGKRPMGVKAITHDEAAAIYKKQYWDAIGADMLTPGVDLLGFEISVNSGASRSCQWLNETSHLQGLARIVALDARRRGFWMRLPIFRTFGKGWMRRENACLALAKKMAGA